MDQQETERVVIARMPDLSSSGPVGGRGSNRLTSRGRIINQALSFKTLAVVTFFLVGIAIGLGGRGRSTDSSPAASPATARAGLSSVVPVQSGNAITQTPQSAPAPVNPPPTQSMAPQPKVAEIPSPPVQAEMSAWPPTFTPDAGKREPHASDNEVMATRPSDYIRNSYDRTRSGVH
jgi:hypothetical protein